MGGLIDMEWKGYESIIHDGDLCLAMFRCVDVADQKQGHFRHQHAIVTSSFHIDYTV